ncbi:MAG: cupin domain-containing protein [Candidatus Hodarchaeota archaeon]
MSNEVHVKDMVEIYNLNDMLDYQEGSVVSRTLIDKNEGTVTLFSFDKDQGLSEHTAPFDALVNVIDGKVKITISKEDYILNKGQMIIMPANEPHALKALERFKMMLIMIKEKNK